jgi:hypothetical protein
MNCETCQDLLSDHLDGALGREEQASVNAHLAACAECAAAREEFLTILGAASEAHEHLFAPPDEYALWRRIRASVEAEQPAPRAAAARGFWARLRSRTWEFTLPQLATAAAALVVAVSLGTTLGVQYLNAGVNEAPDRGRARVAETANYPQTYLQPHQASLRYWEQRVELRRASWNPRMRDSFDRSVTALDSAVDDSLRDLRQNPHDEVAEEMLNSALRDKIELLREFGEQ